MSFISSSDTGITALNTVLAEEANRINADIHKRTLHVSPWIDLIKKSAFPEGMGYQLTTLVYDRAIPTSASSGNAFGLNWHEIGVVEASNTFNTSLATGRNALAGATKQLAGPSGGDTDLDNDFDSSDGNSGDVRSFINFSKQLKQYKLKRAVVESPRLSLEDLRFAAHRQEQLRAVMDLMTEATRYSWENRNRDEFDRIAANLVPCLATSTPIVTTIDVSASTKFEGVQTVDVDLNNDFVSSGVDVDYTPVANISHAVLDKIYQRLVRAGAGMTAYGRENGRPVFGLVLSSEASYRLQTTDGARDDYRYAGNKVSELLQPLGVERSQRGFYHLIDDLAPRFTVSSGTLTRVQPYTVSGGIVTDNASYETATLEAAYVIHSEVMECQIPNPFAGAGAVKFDPVSFHGTYSWRNTPDEIRNPDGLIGYFRGLMASATKPIHTSFGFVILFDRTSGTSAGV